MKIALISEVFSKRMGYLGNILPKYLARQGAEVHLITLDLPPYHHLKDFHTTYSGFAEHGELVPGAIEPYQGFTLHVLPHRKTFGYMRMVGLCDKLSTLRPDIVQATTAIGWNALNSALYQPLGSYKLFTGCHMASSVFSLARKESSWWDPERIQCLVMRSLPGRLVSLFTEKCYAATEDCGLIASRFFGVQAQKVEVMYLGVDTEYFSPVKTDADLKERIQLRQQLGFTDDEIVCIYTGKFTSDKKGHLLADAVVELRSKGLPYRALFIGQGPEGRELAKYSGVSVIGFMPFTELGPYYRAADIGVWPGNESTSMLDAAACGIPIVISDEVFYRAPVDGNGRVFCRDSCASLVEVLFELRNRETRMELGNAGASRMAREFSWESIAKRRLRDYEMALAGKGPLRNTATYREKI
ncbi:MAG: glycosyltransferase family 4 protein [Candidatus Acidiferrum sp.]